MYIEIYIADWVRLAENLELHREERVYRLGIGYTVPDVAFNVMMAKSYGSWSDQDADGLRWHPDRWMAQHDSGIEKSGTQSEFESTWSMTWNCVLLGTWCESEECAAPNVYSTDSDVELLEDAQSFLNPLDADEAQWRPYSKAIGKHGLYWSLSPAQVQNRMDAWTRLSPRLGDLHKYIEPHLSDNHRIMTPDQFTTRMQKWAEMTRPAAERGWGLAYRYF